jgi:RPA family protein
MTAVKLRIQDLVEGTYDGKSVHTPFGDISEARILGTLIDVFITDDSSYISLTVDDGTETVRIKAWRQDVEKLKKFSKGDFLDVVGKVREYNEEIYLTPEVVTTVSPNKWVLRELELMKLYIQSGAVKKVEPEFSEASEGSEPPAILSEESTATDVLEEQEEKEAKEEEVELEEIEEFEILGEDEVVETVLDLLQEGMTKEAVITQSGLDEIDVELALRELLDEGKIKKEGDTYRRADSD